MPPPRKSRIAGCEEAVMNPRRISGHEYRTARGVLRRRVRGRGDAAGAERRRADRQWSATRTRSRHALGRQWPVYVAYATSFITIGIIWINHHACISRLRSADHPILILNLLLLMWVALLPFATSLMTDYLRLRTRGASCACDLRRDAVGDVDLVRDAQLVHPVPQSRSCCAIIWTSAARRRSSRGARSGSRPTRSRQRSPSCRLISPSRSAWRSPCSTPCRSRSAAQRRVNPATTPPARGASSPTRSPRPRRR